MPKSRIGFLRILGGRQDARVGQEAFIKNRDNEYLSNPTPIVMDEDKPISDLKAIVKDADKELVLIQGRNIFNNFVTVEGNRIYLECDYAIPPEVVNNFREILEEMLTEIAS